MSRTGSQADLFTRFAALPPDRGLRQRDAAAALGVSEGALVEAKVTHGAGGALTSDFHALIEALPAVGKVMALTRNEHCVHEKYGTFGGIDLGEGMGQVVGPEIDLRLFFASWGRAWHLIETVKSGERRSIQFYDKAGTAILKVYATDDTDHAAWGGLVARFADTDPAPFVAEAPPAPENATDRPDVDVDMAALRNAWLALTHTHEFFMMLREHKVGRLQALRLVGSDLAEEVPVERLLHLLQGAAGTGIGVMCFVGNRGCLQIHSGPVNRIEPMGPWLNVLDPGFNLHLRRDRIASLWVVRKPTATGENVAVEAYDAECGTIMRLFGLREPGKAQSNVWRALIGDTLFAEGAEA